MDEREPIIFWKKFDFKYVWNLRFQLLINNKKRTCIDYCTWLNWLIELSVVKNIDTCQLLIGC